MDKGECEWNTVVLVQILGCISRTQTLSVLNKRLKEWKYKTVSFYIQKVHKVSKVSLWYYNVLRYFSGKGEIVTTFPIWSDIKLVTLILTNPTLRPCLYICCVLLSWSSLAHHKLLGPSHTECQVIVFCTMWPTRSLNMLPRMPNNMTTAVGLFCILSFGIILNQKLCPSLKHRGENVIW